MKWKMLSIVLITAVLMYTPYVSDVVKVLNTMFHEGGHAIMTLITNGEVKDISLFSNTEGVTTSATTSWFSSLLTSLSGYIFASAIALGFSFLWSRHKHKTILYGTLIFSVLNLVLWVRNLYGISWLVLFSACLILVLMKVKKSTFISSLSLIITLVLVTQAILSSFDILYLSYVTPKDAGDASNLANSTFIPSLVWGILFFVQSLVMGFFSLRFLWKTKEKSFLHRR